MKIIKVVISVLLSICTIPLAVFSYYQYAVYKDSFVNKIIDEDKYITSLYMFFNCQKLTISYKGSTIRDENNDLYSMYQKTEFSFPILDSQYETDEYVKDVKTAIHYLEIKSKYGTIKLCKNNISKVTYINSEYVKTYYLDWKGKDGSFNFYEEILDNFDFKY